LAPTRNGAAKRARSMTGSAGFLNLQKLVWIDGGGSRTLSARQRLGGSHTWPSGGLSVSQL
jgi:hypothetical protein